MAATALALVGMGMVPSQATELAAQLNGSQPDAARLVAFGFNPFLANELVTQILSGQGSPLRLMGYGLPPNIANYIAGNIVPAFALGVRVVSYGDSIIEQNHRFTASTELSDQTAGEVVWALAQLPRFRHEVKFDAADVLGRSFIGMNQGDSGDTAANMAGATRLNAALALNGQIYVVAGGTNDITFTGGITATMVQGFLNTIVTTLLAAGKYVVLCTIRPRSDWTTPDIQNDPRFAIRAAVNNWIKSQNRTHLYIWDPNIDIEDFSARQGLGGLPKAGYMDAGGVHPGTLGGYYGSLQLKTLLTGLVASGTIYDHTLNNTLTNWQLAGTSGNRNPTTAGLITGPGGGANQIADTWRVSRASGTNTAAVETSKEADGANSKQVLTFKPGGSSAFENWTFQYFLGGTPNTARDASIDDGEWVQGFVTIESSAYDFWGGINLYLAARDAGDVIVWQSYGPKYMDRTNQKMPNVPLTLTMATVPFQVTSAMTKFQFQVECYPKMNVATGNAILKISRPWFGVVPDPATYWS